MPFGPVGVRVVLDVARERPLLASRIGAVCSGAISVAVVRTGLAHVHDASAYLLVAPDYLAILGVGADELQRPACRIAGDVRIPPLFVVGLEAAGQNRIVLGSALLVA